MKSLRESLFDNNISKNHITSLYDIFKGHIIKIDRTYTNGRSWTIYFDKKSINTQWEKEGKPDLHITNPKKMDPNLVNFFAIIFNNIFVYKDSIAKTDDDGNFNCDDLNKRLKNYDVILPDDVKTKDGKDAQTYVMIQIGYLERMGNVGIHYRQVGPKRFKGFDTDKIEISIYCYDPRRRGRVHCIYTILTDLTIKDFQ